jgi:hypothetical protein
VSSLELVIVLEIFRKKNYRTDSNNPNRVKKTNQITRTVRDIMGELFFIPPTNKV